MNFSPVFQWSFPSSHCLSVIADHSTAVKLVFTVHYGIFHGRGCIQNAGLSWGCIKDEYLGWGCTRGYGGSGWGCTRREIPSRRVAPGMKIQTALEEKILDCGFM